MYKWEGISKQKWRRVDFAWDGPSSSMCTDEATTGACALASSRLTPYKSHTSLRASIIAFDSLCHTFKHLVIFVCLWTEIQSNCCSIKDFLLFPLNSICLLSPTKYTSAHTPKYTHPTESEMTHLAQTISSKNSDQLLIYFWRFH